MNMKFVSAEEAIKLIKSEDRVFVHGSAATPHLLLNALAKASGTLRNVELVAISTLGSMEIANKKYESSFYFNSLFVSDNVREAINSERGEYIPIFLSEINRLFEKQILRLDVALVHLSPPDKHGFCSLGTSVDVARSAVLHAKRVIAQINPNMPRTHGDSFIHVNELDALVECNDALPEVIYGNRITEADKAIGKFCAGLIEDRSTLQMGIGCIPDAVLKNIGHCKDLGIHTEMFSDGVIDLIKNGVVNNKFKKKHPHKTVSSFAIGSRALYDFIDDNPQFQFLEADYVNDGRIIRSNPKVVAINSALELDLTGQICSDSIGSYHYSGVGGQMDFIRGASLSEQGKPIIALKSTTKKGDSKIVPFLKQGAGVVTTRAHVHYVITEYGVAYLYGKNLHQRALALTKIAHPDHREHLEQEVIKRFGSKNHFVK
ncbi:MAG TPA: acetyl-CoA hydrolase/transferase C-terminal domain-containing protein [Cyclobacteriaceae bacterium]|nr:4-hydroxybutyrate CoA-transferase [Cyclobacteriaceae bacterium]HNP07771.1 acetyl-CoA hydrolase/transferase C-terminal domain-containing protein [Cyclobacteriaceae bacterium]HRK53647.1 acetyl-CoA hydrolase/transferase C-terminal domain-containing protein [Cyclobacteriaceae bacterium]